MALSGIFLTGILMPWAFDEEMSFQHYSAIVVAGICRHRHACLLPGMTGLRMEVLLSTNIELEC